MASPPTIAIIGGGFSGTLTALNMLRLEHRSRPRVILYERGPAAGPGVAYSTRSAVHYLNVPAGNMSAWEQDPQHFVGWLQLRNPAAGGSSFVTRAWYGDYLREQVEFARAKAGENLEIRRASVTAVRPAGGGRFTIHDDGADSSANVRIVDHAVLAIGNFPPPPPPGADAALLGHPGYIGDPWKNDQIAAILPDEPVLLIGTGLTMMDVVMTLHAREHAGPLCAISRHGLIPRPHRSPARPPPPPSGRPVIAGIDQWDGRGGVRALLHLIRASVREHAGRGTDWREVIAALRPMTSRLWQRLDERERRRFLQRLRSYWEIVRHRAAPETAAAVADLIAARQLTVRAGSLVRIAPSAVNPGRQIDVTFRPRRSENAQSLRVSRVINCLGPQTDLARIDDPLVRQLLADGLVTADPHGLGIAVDAQGAPVDAHGRPVEGLWVVGPLRKGQHWENTAVPELRRQAPQVAQRILLTLGGPASAAWPALRAEER
jgi:uncharacterized NAD(P)/FAD-binding protein YdhS